jgi:hypothetical protein
MATELLHMSRPAPRLSQSRAPHPRAVQDELLLTSPAPGYQRPSSAIRLRLKPDLAAAELHRARSSRPSRVASVAAQKTHRMPPQLPQHLVASPLPAKSTAYLSANLSSESATKWSAAWGGSKSDEPRWRAAPTIENAATIDSQAAAGVTMMRLALHRPVAREVWAEAVESEVRRQKDAKRQQEVERRREFREQINPILAGRSPPPRKAWQPPSPSKVVVQYGRNNEAVDQAFVKGLQEAEAQRAAELRVENEKKASQASEELKSAVDAEAAWWEWYWATKKEREAEAARKLEEERVAELKRLRERYLK